LSDSFGKKIFSGKPAGTAIPSSNVPRGCSSLEGRRASRPGPSFLSGARRKIWGRQLPLGAVGAKAVPVEEIEVG
jgi:hypothetical protein